MERIKNDYHSIAVDNLKYLEVGLQSTHYNKIATDAQEVAEKMLKSVAE